LDDSVKIHPSLSREARMKSAIRIIVAFLVLLPCGESKARDTYRIWEGQERPYYEENDLEQHDKVSSVG